MSVIGIDIGAQNSTIAVARQGGIEIVTNEYNYRVTPSIVNYGGHNSQTRLIGENARTYEIRKPQETCKSFKRLIGLKYNDPFAQEEIKRLYCQVVEGDNGECAFPVTYRGEEVMMTAKQVMASFLTQMKHTTEFATGSDLRECVISVPHYYTDAQRRAMLDATRISGINCLRLVNDTTATAIGYGIYKQDLPDADKPGRVVVFVDMGYSNFQASVVVFNKGKLEVLSTAHDGNLGGRDFDQIVAEKLKADIEAKYKIQIGSNKRSWMKIYAASDKLKKQMSTNSQELPVTIEGVFEDIDGQAKMGRQEFEEKAASLIARIPGVLAKAIAGAKLPAGQGDRPVQKEDVFSIEVVGGSTRVPMVKDAIAQFFGKDVSTTLNQDEAVSRGCALQCAILSHNFRVREFNVTDASPYGIKITYQKPEGAEETLEVFDANHAMPRTKVLTFYRRQNFGINAAYAHPERLPTTQVELGRFEVNDVKPDAQGQPSKVKVKVAINGHGIFSIENAHMVEEVEEIVEEEPAKMDVDSKKDEPSTDAEGEKKDKSAEEAEKKGESAAEGEKKGDEMETDKPAPKKQRKIRRIDLPIAGKYAGTLAADSLKALCDVEQKMTQNDRVEVEKRHAKNAVEEYVYSMRGKVEEELRDFVSPAEKSTFVEFLNKTEEWLYDEGEDLPKEKYVERMNEMRAVGEKIKARAHEHAELPKAFEAMRKTLFEYRKFVDHYRQGDERYAHIAEEDVKKVEDILTEKANWLEGKAKEQSSKAQHDDPVVRAAEVRANMETVDRTCRPIVNKPKPAPPKEEKKEEDSAKEGEDESQGNGDSAAKPEMEVDQE
eukprot:Clim_evm22s157 gene=Clim_evmTU22s157